MKDLENRVLREQKGSYHTLSERGAPMDTFLQRFAAVVWGLLSGFDRNDPLDFPLCVSVSLWFNLWGFSFPAF